MRKRHVISLCAVGGGLLGLIACKCPGKPPESPAGAPPGPVGGATRALLHYATPQVTSNARPGAKRCTMASDCDPPATAQACGHTNNAVCACFRQDGFGNCTEGECVFPVDHRSTAYNCICVPGVKEPCPSGGYRECTTNGKSWGACS